MTTTTTVSRQGSLARYSAKERKRLIRKQAGSGLSKREFCEREGVNLGTFYGWTKQSKPKEEDPAFAEVEIAGSAETAVEVLLPNGVRIGLRHQGERKDLVELIRGVAGC